jgi:hypothetical protein
LLLWLLLLLLLLLWLLLLAACGWARDMTGGLGTTGHTSSECLSQLLVWWVCRLVLIQPPSAAGWPTELLALALARLANGPLLLLSADTGPQVPKLKLLT